MLLYSTEIELATLQDVENVLHNKIDYYVRIGNSHEVKKLKTALDAISDLQSDMFDQEDNPPKTFYYVVDYDEKEAWGHVCARNEKEADCIVRNYYGLVDNVRIFAYKELVEGVCLSLGDIDERGSN